MLSLSSIWKPRASSDLDTPIAVPQNSDQVMLTQSPDGPFQVIAFSLAYFSAFVIWYSGVVIADLDRVRTFVDLTLY